MTQHIDNWATIDRGPICTRCKEPKRNHAYYGKTYRCMSSRSSMFTQNNSDTIHPPFTIKRRKEKNSMAKAKIVKMPKAAKKKTTTKAKSAAKSTKKVGSKFMGKTSGLGVSDFQNKTIAGNKRDHLTDLVIAKMWRDEFPKAKSYTEKDVASVRSAFNKGKHGNDAPARPIAEYDRDGNPIKNEKASSDPPKRVSKKPPKKTVSKAALRKKKIKEEDEEEEEETLNSNSMEEDEDE
jgi:hypothetical protein